MKTPLQTQIDFEEMTKRAEKLNSLAWQLEVLAAERMANTLQLLGTSWTGEAAAWYLGKGQELEEKLQKNSMQLKKIAESLRVVAHTIYQAKEGCSRTRRKER